MRAKAVATEIMRAVEARCAELKSAPLSLLLQPTSSAYAAKALQVAGHNFKIQSWFEPPEGDNQGLGVVLVGCMQKRWYGSTHHMGGFALSPSSPYRDLGQRELWARD
jgi:hypothetical protein